MKYEFLTQGEFLSRYHAGQREFSHVTLQFAQFSTTPLTDVVIKDSKFLFCSFRGCDLSRTTFENCQFYWDGFYNMRMTDVIFDRCSVELTLFENIQIDRVVFERCSLRMSAVFNSNHASLNLTTSTQSRFFTDLSQFTSNDVDAVVAETLSSIAHFEGWIQQRLKDILRKDLDHYGLRNSETAENVPYQKPGDAGGTQPLQYNEVRTFVEKTFGSYGSQNPYKTKPHPYEKKDTYRS